jgi:uncharacterized small protein (DUF1192 family)
MTTNYPSAGGYSNEPKKDNRGTIIIILVFALIASWGYFLYSNNKSNNLITEKDAQYSLLDSTKNAVQQEYDEAMSRLTEMTQTNSSLDSLVKSKDTELESIKGKFRSLVNKQNATSKDLAEARLLVSELNGRINQYVQEIERLQAENQQLTTDKANLTTEKKALEQDLSTTQQAKKEAEDKVDVGSTLHASRFSISPINEKNSGKEKTTARAKKVDKLRISFLIDENRISVSGKKILYIIAKDPSGKIITESELGSGKFDTRQDGSLSFTNRVEIDYEQGKEKSISFDLKQTEKYVAGNYGIMVYQNGFKIGEGIAILK